MALADRRPFGIPVTSTPASPAFNPKSIDMGTKNDTGSSASASGNGLGGNSLNAKFKSSIQNIKGKLAKDDLNPLTPEKSVSPVELSPTLRSISPDSLMALDSAPRVSSAVVSSSSSLGSSYSRESTPGLGAGLQNLPKKAKTSRVPIATGISTTIPVTGEKPKPSQKDDPSLEDDVLYAIFLILFEEDPNGKGMTVKQICDILVEQHPEMANLSTKTSNLVSAKLNAYVKRVEKGDSSLKYALSRDWADASPKRMVYVYRGLLAENFHLHVKNLMEVEKQKQKSRSETSEPKDATRGFTSHESDNQAYAPKRRQTMYDLGVTKNSFMESKVDKSNLFVPYSSAPVTASLTETFGEVKRLSPKNQESDLELEDFEVFQDEDDEDNDNPFNAELTEMWDLRKNNKRSKSMSYLTNNKKPKILTAAAAAPRAPRTLSAHNPNAVAAAAALHAAALKAISAPSSQDADSDRTQTNSNPCLGNKNWLDVVRSGFLTQDIGTPEDISLSDLDKFFT